VGGFNVRDEPGERGGAAVGGIIAAAAPPAAPAPAAPGDLVPGAVAPGRAPGDPAPDPVFACGEGCLDAVSAEGFLPKRRSRRDTRGARGGGGSQTGTP
jgi:hypothetical protein